MIVEKGAATIDLNNHRLTADASATIKIKENGDDVVVAVAVKDGAKVMVKTVISVTVPINCHTVYMHLGRPM